ncbi:MAG: hypothetical protein KGI02_07995 [Thaumarchaeota archaeon]|nr:hypothetical protein [Nitrososphaerota archaeon]MDE1832293.1 hypothetical protein [Nitrososphaerota archaeon]MDE1841433.1 hypothetical protein [Nitrososphaerota archaeon]MDE1878631.1 hypothetical protein [Nitrososphaerota archaeon]
MTPLHAFSNDRLEIQTVWKEAKAMTGTGDMLVVDYTTLDKPYATKMETCNVTLERQTQARGQGNQPRHVTVD